MNFEQFIKKYLDKQLKVLVSLLLTDGIKTLIKEPTKKKKQNLI